MIYGQCLCGKVKYIYRAHLEESILCFCKHCQLAQGGVMAWNSAIDQSKFELITGGEILKSYFHTPLKARVFCGECASPIYSYRKDLPNIIRLRLGTVTQGQIPSPNQSFYHQYQPAFIEIKGVKTFN